MTGGEILGYFKNGQFWGFGGGAPDCRRLSGVQGPQAPAGVKGAEPLCFVIAVNRQILAFSHMTSNRKVKFSFWALR